MAESDYRSARAELEKAQAGAPENAAILVDLAVAQAAMGDLTTAATTLDRALEIEPTRAEAIFNRALIRQGLKRYDEAREDWKHYLEADPSSPWANEARRFLSE